jgi:N-acyl-phosphatidylethanolamine-hydrolysing phospholipase D
MRSSGPVREVPTRFRSARDSRGRFYCPWVPVAEQVKTSADILRWQRERSRSELPPTPEANALPVVHDGLRSLGDADGAVWVGHATAFLRLGGFNVLTDPVFSDRVSPVQWAGPRRIQPPGLRIADLPRLDAVLITHDHYDHLDRTSVRALARGSQADATWFAPLGHGEWLRRQGVRRVVELDWWETSGIPGPGGRRLLVTCTPAQHWTRRDPFSSNRRLWGGFAVRARGPAGSRAAFFAGDSGYFEGFREIGRVLGPFDLSLIPVGAYEPRWFMRFAHMNPEEAVETYRDLGGVGLMLPIHWGTFRLTDEDPLEPPVRLEAAWARADLPPASLVVLHHGGGCVLPGQIDQEA